MKTNITNKLTPFVVAALAAVAPTSLHADDINTIFRSEPDMTLEEARDLATDGAVSYNTDEKDKVVNFTGQITVGFEADLAAISDDGSTIVVNGGAASSRFGNPQDLYSPDQSFQSAGVLSPGTHTITLDYKNSIQADANDFNGVVLVAFGGSRPISGVTLKTVTFSSASVTKDAGGSYSGAHYDSSRTGDIAHPVAWKTGSKPSASATFTLTPVNTKKKVKIRGTGGGLWFPAQELTPSAGKVTYASTASTNALPATISAGNIDIAWQYSTDNGTTYQSVGSSSNKAYVSLSGSGGIETVLHLACNYASGKSTSADAFTGIWNYFDTNAVARVDGQPMKYWGTFQQANRNTSIGFSKEDLIKNKDGRCDSWQNILDAALRVQNVTASSAGIVVEARTFNTEYGPLVGRGRGFEINPLAGQNNSAPYNFFVNHAVIERNYSIYDPSYGSSYLAASFNEALSAWEEAAVKDLYYSVTVPGEAEETDIIRPNTPNVRETKRG